MKGNQLNRLVRNVFMLTAAVLLLSALGCNKSEKQNGDGGSKEAPAGRVGGGGEGVTISESSQTRFQFEGEIDINWQQRFIGYVESVTIQAPVVEELSASFSYTPAGKLVAELPSGRRIVVCPEGNVCGNEWVFYAVLSASIQELLLAHVKEPPGLSLNFKDAGASEQDASCQDVEFASLPFPATQFIPLCHSKIGDGYESFNFDAEVKNTTDHDLSIVMLYLGADGCIVGINEEDILLKKGGVYTHAGGSSSLPVNRSEYLVALGSSDPRFNFAGFNSCEQHGAELLVQLLTQVQAQEQGMATPQKIIGVSREFQTVLNRVLADASGGADVGQPREYTVQNFDIRPYLPDINGSSLYKVLSAVQRLTGKSHADGIGYTQHDWSKASDAENLAVGIDCSRAIWYSFTRSNLPYTETDVENNNYNAQPYIPTISMVGEDSILSGQFERCDDQEKRLGDVLVYRRTDKDSGHVVMVIDPKQRIAWGSHGWDGNGLTPDVVPDVGAEYQLIKRKKDWQAWDRRTMTLRACWRHKDFVDIDPLDIGNNAVGECDFNLERCQRSR